MSPLHAALMAGILVALLFVQAFVYRIGYELDRIADALERLANK